ncbi:MAG: hypothetical protein F4Y40_06200 [Acidimicrobiia bacterium]|nr:hypothetical protein [Acidimicrobiia bacterium]
MEGDPCEAKAAIADDVADAVARHLVHGRRGSPRDLVTVVFHDMDPDYSLVEYMQDEIEASPPSNDPVAEKLKGTGRRMWQATGRQVGAVDRAGRAVARRARTVARASTARVQGLTGGAVSQMGLVGGQTYARFSEFGAALNEAISEQMRRLDRNATRLRDDPVEWCKATGASASAAFLTVEQMVPSFADLSPAVKAKFALAGLRGVWRPVEVAQAFFEEGVPAAVRNLGEDAVLKFVEGKHASHIRAVANAPEVMMEHCNIVWEQARDNLVRGAADMRPMELAKANALNAMDAAGIVTNQAIRTAATAGCIGMALEGVVTISENYIYVYKGEKDIAKGVKDTLKDVLKKGGASAIGGVGWMAALSLGAGPAISAAGPVIVTVGGATFVVAAYKRIKTALESAEEPVEPEQLDPGPDPTAPALSGAQSKDEGENNRVGTRSREQPKLRVGLVR